MAKFTGFTKEHVGEKVTDIITMEVGRIIRFDWTNEYPIRVEFNRGRGLYTPEGQYYNDDKFRRLYFGSNIKVEVTGEEVPEPKLICPVCNRDHELQLLSDINSIRSQPEYSFKVSDDRCPFACAYFDSEKQANTAMKNLIKAMNQCSA